MSLTYAGAHQRVVRLRGEAAAHACEECGEPAEEWSFDHSDTRALVDEAGRAYSLNPHFYRPLCRRHHRAFDREQRDRVQLGPADWWRAS